MYGHVRCVYTVLANPNDFLYVSFRELKGVLDALSIPSDHVFTAVVGGVQG
jgi:hypothetical protein